tara:strand:+ start:3588 stop:4787 length:1200 start_codon:yes stop_codon:yes gene_type:complete
MNKHLREAIFKQKVKRMHRQAVRKMLTEQEHNLYTTFVQPFTDVIDATALTGQDILNALRLQFDLLFTLSPKKMEEAHKRFDDRKAKINEKWGPIMERTDEALANSDANLFALVMAPELFLASEALAVGYEKAKDLNTYLSDAGWKIPLASGILGYTPDSDTGTGGADAAEDDTRSLLARLGSLFYIEAAWHDGTLIVEQDTSTPKKEPDFKKAMTKYLKDTGLLKSFEQDAKELLETQKELVDTILNEAVPRLTLISRLTQTSDIDEFVEAIEEAQKEGLDLKAAGLDAAKDEVMKSAESLAQSDEFKNQVAEQSKKSPEDISEEELITAAKNVAFVNAKQEFDKQASQGKEQLKAAALEELQSEVPDETNLSAMRKSPTGLEYIKLIEDAKQKIQNA